MAETGSGINLRAFFAHVGGTMASGHYRDYEKRGEDWFCIDNENVTQQPQSVAQHHANHAYLLLYESVAVKIEDLATAVAVAAAAATVFDDPTIPRHVFFKAPPPLPPKSATSSSDQPLPPPATSLPDSTPPQPPQMIMEVSSKGNVDPSMYVSNPIIEPTLSPRFSPPPCVSQQVQSRPANLTNTNLGAPTAVGQYDWVGLGHWDRKSERAVDHIRQQFPVGQEVSFIGTEEQARNLGMNPTLGGRVIGFSNSDSVKVTWNAFNYDPIRHTHHEVLVSWIVQVGVILSSTLSLSRPLSSDTRMIVEMIQPLSTGRRRPTSLHDQESRQIARDYKVQAVNLDELMRVPFPPEVMLLHPEGWVHPNLEAEADYERL